MQNCPHCAEKISAQARICKHCKRPCLYQASLKQALNEKELYSLAKFFMENPSPALPSSFRELKLSLEKPPRLLKSGMNGAERAELEKALSGIPIEYEANTSSLESEVEAKSSFAQIFYAIAAVLIFSLGVHLYLISDQDKESIQEVAEFSVELPPSPLLDTPQAVSPAPAPAAPQARAELTREDVLQLLDATVFIRGSQSLGSGFLISPDGYILSNSHVTKNMDRPIVSLRNGQQFEAVKVRENTELDISLLRIPAGGLPYLAMGDAEELYPGQSILTIGNPSGLSFTVTRGIISFVGRELDGVKYIQTDAAINPGNSGGPMISSDLKVVGINTLTAKVEKGISFALPINYAYSPGGVAEGIGFYPRTAKTYSNRREPTYQSASLSRDNEGTPSMQLPADLYQKEAQDYRSQLKKSEAEIVERADSLRAKIKKLQEDQNAARFNVNEKARIQSEIDRAVENFNEIPEELRDLRIRYYRQIVSLLQRQLGDSRYSHLSSEIRAQISEIEAEKKKLEDEANP